MEHTEYYQLSLWEQDDRIQMEDFNADNAKIDAALAAVPRIVTGTYTGDGAETRTISLGFTPKAVIIWQTGRIQYASSTCGGISITGYNSSGITLTDNGFTVYQDNTHGIAVNSQGAAFVYLALY